MCWITEARLYAIWAAVGPLAGVIIGGWLASHWQRKQWIADNKAREYREIFDALNTYRWKSINYLARYEVLGAQNEEVRPEDTLSMAEAQHALDNAFSDRIFVRETVVSSGAKEDFRQLSQSFLNDRPPSLNEATQAISNLHKKLVRTAEADLRLANGLRHGSASLGSH